MLVFLSPRFTYWQLLEFGSVPTAEPFAPLFGCGDSGFDTRARCITIR